MSTRPRASRFYCGDASREISKKLLPHWTVAHAVRDGLARAVGPVCPCCTRGKSKVATRAAETRKRQRATDQEHVLAPRESCLAPFSPLGSGDDQSSKAVTKLQQAQRAVGPMVGPEAERRARGRGTLASRNDLISVARTT